MSKSAKSRSEKQTNIKSRQPRASKSEAGKNGDAGKDRRMEILKSARAILVENGYPAFSMRRVANRSGIHLKTLQHYFESKRELILETLDYTLDTHYFKQYVTIFDQIEGNSSVNVLSNIIRYLIEDARTEETSKFFSEMWALSFRYEGARTALDGFYVKHRQQLELLIARANPKITHKSVKLRAGVIASQIEGLVPLIGYDKPDHLGLGDMEREVHDRIMEYVLAS